MADRDFLEEIEKIEAEARLLVEKAREEALLKRQAARQEAARLIDQAYRKASSDRQKRMEEAQARHCELVAEAETSDGSGSLSISRDLLDQAAVMLAERIVSILEHR